MAAWFQSLFQGDRTPVLVGGAAVELYTSGGYTTGDLDFVGDVTPVVAQALKAAGFEKEGRHWILEKGEVFLELPASQLRFGESLASIVVDGISVLTVSPEDMIVDRLAAWEFWGSSTDAVNAFLIWRAQRGRLDLDRLAEQAQRRGASWALARLRTFVEGVEARYPTDDEFESWASQRP